MGSLVDILDARPTSYLTWARQRDVDVYRAATEAGALRERKHRPQSFEMTEQAQIEAALFQLMQQHIHVSSGSRKKSRAKAWPTPETAAEIVKREDANRGYHDLMSEIMFLPQDEFEAEVAGKETSQAVVRHEIEQ